MNFQGFSTDSFEQFIRALALKVIGPGVTIFGNGPDGGREASFRGEVNYPFPPNKCWNGYGVIQAKFKEKHETTKKDQTWAEKQLSAELALWEMSQKRTPKPDYYIFCTNVELSSAANGGREALEKIFKSYLTKLGLKGYAIWDANQLKGYVDGYSEIRQRFSCFFTPGDLLEQFAKLLARVPNPDSILTTFLCDEISADEDARLSQAGDRSEDRIKLANVFIDLPSGKTLSNDFTGDEEHTNNPATLHMLLRAASYKLDPLALDEQRAASELDSKKLEKLYGRYVFLGGPGSGKSTIGQFLAQIHRAALLARRPSHRLEPKVREIIKEIKARCEAEAAPWPITPRFPFRIDLNAFAKTLAAGDAGGVSTLSEYLRRSISRDFKFGHEDLREWLRSFRWLIIFDGLDEVPSSSNRREVVSAIQSFLNEARDVEADLMIVSSSRPDGYAGEFDGDEVDLRYLHPLYKSQALACAQRYVNAKAPSVGDQRATEAMKTLQEAINNPLIARLMRSPLQVTFMVTVVAASGKPSDSRWQLFNDYYRIIYERELHKAVRPFDKVLNERRQDIDALHHRVGFILQCRAERSGGTESDLSKEEFEILVTACLKENGLLEDDLENQTRMIVGAANLRLVFLTSRKPGRLSFDVRSLQEYMAAACLTNTDSKEIQRRLELIAHSAYWRNTFLFAVGRFFVEPQMRAHRDNIRLLCDDLNRKDSTRAAVKLGSWIALEILESGTVGNVPLVNRNLVDCALQLLSIPPGSDDNVSRRLSEVYDASMEKEYQNALTLWTGQKDSPLTLSAWLLALYLERKGIYWAVSFVESEWPCLPQASWEILRLWIPYLTEDMSSNSEREDNQLINTLDERTVNRLSKVIFYIPVEEVISLPQNTRGSDLEWLNEFILWWKRDKTISLPVRFGEKKSSLGVQIHALPTEKDKEFFISIKSLGLDVRFHRDWQVLLAIREFYVMPGKKSLADILEVFAKTYTKKEWDFWSGRLSWPIRCCLKSVCSSDDLYKLSGEVRLGSFGDIQEWERKQHDWEEKGLSTVTLGEMLFKSNANILLAVGAASVGKDDPSNEHDLALALFQSAKQNYHSEALATMAWITTFYADCTHMLHLIDPQEIEKYLISPREVLGAQSFRIPTERIEANPEVWLPLYDKIGRSDKLKFTSYEWNIDELPIQALWNGYMANKSMIGLLRLVGFWCATSLSVNCDIKELPKLKEFSDERCLFSMMLVHISKAEMTAEDAVRVAQHIKPIVEKKTESNVIEILLTAIERHVNPGTEILLTELIQVIPVNEWKLRSRAETARRNAHMSRFSGLSEIVLKEHALPII